MVKVKTGELWIFFPKESGFDLEAASAALRDRGFAAKAAQGRVRMQHEDLLFTMRECGDQETLEIRAVASSKAESKDRKGLKACDGMIEVQVDDHAAALDEINALIAIQLTLQDATKGYLFVGWNCRFQAPDA